MCDEYESAVCNISASGFDSGLHGFLLPTRLQNPISPRMQIGSVASGLYFVVDSAVSHDIREGPIFERAWVLQEQILVRPGRMYSGSVADIL